MQLLGDLCKRFKAFDENWKMTKNCTQSKLMIT